MPALRVLVLDDSADDAALVVRVLERGGYRVESVRVETREAFEAALSEPWDVVVLDYALPRYSGVEGLAALAEREVDVPAIVVSGTIDEVTAVGAMRSGARDFVTKQHMERLPAIVARELEEVEIRREQRRGREALHEAEEKMRLITSQLPAIVWTTGLDLQVTSVVGSDPAALGRSVADVSDLGGADVVSAHRRALAGEPQTYELDREDSVFHCEVRPLRDTAGALIGCIGIGVDLTEERRADEALRRSEARFRSLIENALDIVAIVDTDGRFLYTSPSFERELGYAAAETAGSDGFSLIHPDDRARVWETFVAGTRHVGATEVVEYRFRHRDGSWRTLESIGHNLLDDAAVSGVVITSRDVTDRRRLEEQLQQTRRLEVIGQLAGGVAHDFNNVLLVVRGYAAMLVEHLRGTPQEREAREIVDAADRAAGLTRQLLAFGRRQTLRPVLVDVNDVVGGTETLLRRLLPEDIELIVLRSRRPAVVRADVSQMEQVLVNLATNARDAMPSGGAITVGVETVTTRDDVDTRPPLRAGCYVVVRVADTGNGIDDQSLPRVFDPFFTTKPQGQGTGLGLATVYGIVAQSGGGIAVETAAGAGTTFTVYLPVAAGVVQEAGASGVEAGSDGNETVLLVEDEPQARDLVRAILAEHGYEVLVAAQPSEAIEISRARRGEVDLLVSDVVMPEMSGYELAHELVAEQPQMRSFFISGYASGLRTVGGELEAGVLLLQKPFSQDELLKTARAVLDAPKPAARSG